MDKIVGPGNAYVNEAKRQVFAPVGIDQLAGPNEIFVLADATGDPWTIATDLLAHVGRVHLLLRRPVESVRPAKRRLSPGHNVGGERILHLSLASIPQAMT